MPSWEGSTRKARLPRDWYTIRKRILARDGQRCTMVENGQRCNLPASDVDHIERGDNHADANLRSLCKGHHHKKSSSEGGKAPRRASRKYSVTRPPEKHPGIREAPQQ